MKTTAVTVQLENQVGPSTSNVRSPEVQWTDSELIEQPKKKKKGLAI